MLRLHPFSRKPLGSDSPKTSPCSSRSRLPPLWTRVGKYPGVANQKLKLLWIAIGKDDFLLARNRDFVKALDELKIRHTYQETAGSHAWGVWRGYLAEFLPLLFR